MIDENLIYQLFDTQSPMAHGVSPKTGLFNTYIPIASLVGSNGLGPTLDINLFYSPDMRDLTFKNWALRFTHYFMTPLDKQFENVESVILCIWLQGRLGKIKNLMKKART